MIVLELPMWRSSQFCRGSVSHLSDVARDRWTTRTCNRALCEASQRTLRQKYPRATPQWWKFEDHTHTLVLLQSSGPSPLAETTVLEDLSSRDSLQLSWVQVPFTYHFQRSSRVDHEMSLFRLRRRRCQHYPSLAREEHVSCASFWVHRHR